MSISHYMVTIPYHMPCVLLDHSRTCVVICEPSVVCCHSFPLTSPIVCCVLGTGWLSVHGQFKWRDRVCLRECDQLPAVFTGEWAATLNYRFTAIVDIGRSHFAGRTLFIYLYMKPTHKTVYTMDIKRHNVCCWLIGNCRRESKVSSDTGGGYVVLSV